MFTFTWLLENNRLKPSFVTTHICILETRSTIRQNLRVASLWKLFLKRININLDIFGLYIYLTYKSITEKGAISYFLKVFYRLIKIGWSCFQVYKGITQWPIKWCTFLIWYTSSFKLKFLLNQQLLEILILIFAVWLRNLLISTGLKPVLCHTEKSCIVSYYIQFSTNIKM